jgi:hypothetical protein
MMVFLSVKLLFSSSNSMLTSQPESDGLGQQLTMANRRMEPSVLAFSK